VVGVGEQGEVEVEFAGELAHRLDRVGQAEAWRLIARLKH
jgi:hypothetical protein